MEEFPSNSRRPASPLDSTPPAVEEERKIDKVITGNVIKRKKPLGRRFMDTFFAKDSGGVFNYLFRDVLVPALQDMATDMVKQGIERAVYGEVRSTGRSVRGSSYVPRTHVSYDRPNPVVRPATPLVSPATRRAVVQPSAFDIGEIILDTQINAQVVVAELDKIVGVYGAATVANLNDLIGQTSAYTDHKWGWTDLTQLSVKRIREGYLLILPDPEDLR
jgi:hypothetical protein